MTSVIQSTQHTSSPELVCLADVSVDVVARVPSLPRADEKRSATLVGEFGGGMGANVAAAFARLGGRAGLISCVGDDERGRRSVAELAALGVDISRVDTVAGPTFWTIALIDEQGEKSLIEFPCEASSPPWGRIDWAALDGARAAYTVGAEGREACRLFDECRRRGVTTALDLESADLADAVLTRALLERTDLLFAPAAYAQAVTGAASPRAAVPALLEAGPSLVAVTAGAAGCVVGARGGELLEVPGQAVPVLDTTGAGDCFAGAFLFGFVRGWTPAQCARLATLMAAHSVTAYGSRGRLLGAAELAALPAAAGLPLGAEPR
jgi:ribokinase